MSRLLFRKQRDTLFRSICFIIPKKGMVGFQGVCASIQVRSPRRRTDQVLSVDHSMRGALSTAFTGRLSVYGEDDCPLFRRKARRDEVWCLGEEMCS